MENITMLNMPNIPPHTILISSISVAAQILPEKWAQQDISAFITDSSPFSFGTIQCIQAENRISKPFFVFTNNTLYILYYNIYNYYSYKNRPFGRFSCFFR